MIIDSLKEEIRLNNNMEENLIMKQRTDEL